MQTILDREFLRTKLKKTHIIGQHCQRNFDLDKTIPEPDVELIIHAATECPSKQNLDFYSVYAIQDRDVINQIYDNTKTAKGRRNPQVLGQLLLVFVSNPNLIKNNDINERITASDQLTPILADMHQAIGVAAGFTNITAGMLGYRTGCNKCFDDEAVRQILNLSADENPVLMMGIGIKDDSRNRREEQNTGKIIDTFKKVPIKVTRI